MIRSAAHDGKIPWIPVDEAAMVSYVASGHIMATLIIRLPKP